VRLSLVFCVECSPVALARSGRKWIAHTPSSGRAEHIPSSPAKEGECLRMTPEKSASNLRTPAATVLKSESSDYVALTHVNSGASSTAMIGCTR